MINIINLIDMMKSKNKKSGLYIYYLKLLEKINTLLIKF